MGWISATDDGDGGFSYGWTGGGVTPSPFAPYAPDKKVFLLSIGDHRFEKELSEKALVRQRIKGVEMHVVSTHISFNDIPEVLLCGVDRAVFAAKAKVCLWPKEPNVTFLPQGDGSYAADQIFFDNVQDIVKRCKR